MNDVAFILSICSKSNAKTLYLSLRGTSRGLTCTVYDDIGDIDISYSSTLGCDVAIRWKAPLLQWRFREIATSNENHVFLAMTLFDIAKYCLLTNKLPIAPIRRSTPNSNGETNIVHTFTLQWAARCCIGATSERRRAGAEAVSKRKPRSERRGWEISFKSALLLVAEGVISTFFGDMPH